MLQLYCTFPQLMKYSKVPHKRNLSLKIMKHGEYKTKNTLLYIMISKETDPNHLKSFRNGIYMLLMPMVWLQTRNVVKK